MSDKKRQKSEEDIYMDMVSPKACEKHPKFPPDENIYMEMKSVEFNQDVTRTPDKQECVDLTDDVPKFRDQHRPSVTGKNETSVVDLTCNCALPCEGPCSNGLVSKKVTLYESLLTDYQKEIQSTKTVETSIDPPPRNKNSLKRKSENESSSIKRPDLKSVALSAKKNLAHYFSSSTLDASKEVSSIEIDNENESSQVKTEDFRSLFTSTPFQEGNNTFPRRNSSLPDLSNSKSICSFEEHSLHQQISDSENDSTEEDKGSDEDLEDSKDQITQEKQSTPKRPSRKKSGILFVHSNNSSDKPEKTHHAKFSFPAITNIKRQNDLLKTNSSIRASVNILDLSKRCRNAPHTMRKADSVAALTPHEHENPSNLNVRRRLDKTNRVKTLRKRINKAFRFQKSDSSCWPKVFRRKKMMKRSNSGKLLKRSYKHASQSTESFATIFLANEKKLSSTLPDNWKHEMISEDLFTSDVQESIEFPEHVTMTDIKGKNKRRTLRERLLSPKRLLSKDSTTSLDSEALKKAISFLDSSLHPSGSSNENNINAHEVSQGIQSLNRQESYESVGASSETLDSITSARSASCVQRAMSHDSSAEHDFFKKISIKTKLFLRTASIPDMAPRILNAFSKTSSSSNCDDHNSNECLEGVTKSGKFSNRLKRDTLSNLGSLLSAEPIKENDEEEADGEDVIQTSDTCTAEVHGVKSEVIKTESQTSLENSEEKEETSFEVAAFPSERKPSIVVTDENLHDHLLTMENINAVNGSENETQLPVLVENIDQNGKFAKESTNTESDTSTENLLSPRVTLDDGEHLNTDDLFQHFGANCDFFDDATTVSVNMNLSKSVNSQNSTASDTVPRLTESYHNHRGSDELDVCEQSESTNRSASEGESSDDCSFQVSDNSKKTVCCDQSSQKEGILSTATMLTSESKSFKQFAINISPLKSENTELHNEQNSIVERVLKTERCVDTGRTVITYNAPLNGEHVKIDLHEIDPSAIPLEKCVDTGRTVISCKAALNRQDSLENAEDKALTTSLVQESSMDNICSDASEDSLGNAQENSLDTPVDTNSLDINKLWDSMENSPCNDCESSRCGIPIVCIDTDFHQEESIVSEELHQEITSWKLNMCNEGYFKNNRRSSLLPPDDRRRIRANSIPESDFECEEVTDDSDCNNLRQTIKDGLQNRKKLLSSDRTDENEKDQISSTEMTVPRVSSSDNILKISKNDDFFDFFRDRAQEEHYAYILDSDSENEEECAKAVVEYLVNARRGSVDTLLSQKTDDSNHLQPQKVNVETGSLALSDCSSRRSSKMEPIEPIKDDVFDFFDGTGRNDFDGDLTTDCTIDETKCNPHISKTSEKDLTCASGNEDHLDNLASDVSSSDATDAIVMPKDQSDFGITEAMASISDINEVDEMTCLETFKNKSNNGDQEEIDLDGQSVAKAYDSMSNLALVSEKNKNCSADDNNDVNPSGNEDVCENSFGVKNRFDAATYDDDKRSTSASETIPDDCQIEIIKEVDVQKTYAVEKCEIQSQSVEKTDEANIVEPETKYIAPTIHDNKRVIVRKDNRILSTTSDLSNRDEKDNKHNTLTAEAPSKPPRLFTVRLIPEHAWRSKSSRDFSRKSPNSLQPETHDLHVTKSFNDIPTRVSSVSEPFSESEIVRKNHSDERFPLHVSAETLNASAQNCEPNNRPNESVKHMIDSRSNEISVKISKSTLNNRNSFLCPDENDDFFDYFKNDNLADDDIELLAQKGPSPDKDLSSKTDDDQLERCAVTDSQSPPSDYCLEEKSNPKNDSIAHSDTATDAPKSDLTNGADDNTRQLVVTNDALSEGLPLSPPNSLKDEGSEFTCTASTSAVMNKDNQRECEQETSDLPKDFEQSDRSDFVCDGGRASDVNRNKQSHDELPSERLLDLPKVENRRGSFLEENDDFFDYFENEKSPPEVGSRAQAVVRQGSIETSDVTGYSIFHSDRNCCENYYNSNVHSVPMLETKMPLRNRDCGDYSPSLELVNDQKSPPKINPEDDDNQNCLSERELCENGVPSNNLPDSLKSRENHCKSYLSECPEASLKNVETISIQPHDLAIKQLLLSGLEVGCDKLRNDGNKITSTYINPSKIGDALTENFELSTKGIQDMEQAEPSTVMHENFEKLSGLEMREEDLNGEPYDDNGKVTTADSQSNTLLADAPEIEQSRRGSFLEENDDFYDYFDENGEKSSEPKKSSEDMDIGNQRLVTDSNKDCKLETYGNLTLSIPSPAENSTEIVVNRRGSFIEDDDDFFDYFNDKLKKKTEHQEPLEISPNKSSGCGVAELDSQPQITDENADKSTEDQKLSEEMDVGCLRLVNESNNDGKLETPRNLTLSIPSLAENSAEIVVNRRGSFIEDDDDFFDYFIDESKKTPEDREELEISQNKSFSSDEVELDSESEITDESADKSTEDRKSSKNMDIDCLRMVDDSNNDCELETTGNLTLSIPSPAENSAEIIVNRRGSFIEDNDDFFDYFEEKSKNTPENQERNEISENNSSSCDAVGLVSQSPIILCKKTEAGGTRITDEGIIHTIDVPDDSDLRCTKESSNDFDIKVSPICSKLNSVASCESNSDSIREPPFESSQSLSSSCEDEQIIGQLINPTENEIPASSHMTENEEAQKNISQSEHSFNPTDCQPVNCHEKDTQLFSDIDIPSDTSETPKVVMELQENEHHIESIIKKDHTPAGPRRRSVTFNLPILDIPQDPPESSIMVSYCSTEDPFEYFGSCEPVAPVLKDDPFDYFTTSSTVSASRDILDSNDCAGKPDSQMNDLPNAANTCDQSASHVNVDLCQHDPHPHDPHQHDSRRRESHFDLLPIVEANPDQLAVEEASYETMNRLQTNCTLIGGDGVEPVSIIDEPEEEVTGSVAFDNVEVIPDRTKPAASEPSLKEMKQSVNSIASSEEHCCEVDKTHTISQQKPVILKLIPKETSEITNDHDQVLETSSSELNKPLISECLIDLSVAKVFEIIDLAEKTGSTSSLTKVAEEFVSNSPQYRTKFTHYCASSKNRKEESSLPKTVSMSYETLLDSVDGPCNRPIPFPPTYCHAWKSLFPNVSTSDLSNLEQMDDNYSPRSLALGKPTIILQTWFERQKLGNASMRPARSSSDLVELFSRLSVPQKSPSVTRSESLPPRKRLDTPSPGTPVDQFKEDSVEEQPPRQEERVQKDRSLDVYPETLRQRQRHRNMAPSPSKVDIKNWNQNGSPIREPESPASGKKFLPSVKALRNQFETGKNLNSSSSNNGSVSPTSTFSMSSSSSNASTGSTQGCGAPPTSGGGVPRIADPSASLSRKLSGSSLASSSLEKSSSNTSLNSAPSTENLLDGDPHDSDEPVEPIFCQFQKVDEELRELMSRPTSTSGWDPRSLLKRLYYVPEVPRVHSKGHSYINIEGYLEKLPSGRKKATFWNAWKKRYFVAKDGVLYYYQNSQCDKQSLRLTLMGGKVETMEGNMVGVDDGKGHYVVVRCSSRSEADRWRRALESHLVEDFASQYVQPHPMSTNPSLLRDTLIIDIGSCSVRAGVLSSQATLPQLFFPSVVATVRESRRQVWGQDALSPETRSSASLSFPMKPSHRISKYSVDLTAVASLLTKTFSDLKVDPKNYNLQISVPRVLNQHTQSELLRVLFEKFGVKGVNVTHQSILALYAYNATSGIVVDIGERMDIVPVIDGYIVEGGVSRVPYGGCRILDHLRQFLYMRNVSLVNDVESYIIRHVLESACYCAQHYNTEKARCTNNPENFEKIVPLKEFFPNTAQCPYDAVELDFGRFQATEGLFNPDAWGLDHPGLHKLVHKAIQECSMDIRKEMSRSIFLAGGVTQLPGLADRLTTELDNLTPPAIRPKVHVSPYRYHAAYIGACTLTESPAFSQTLITRENWAKNGNAALRKWAL